jgi:hypothetical protein
MRFNAAVLKIISALGGDPKTGRCLCPCHDDGENPSLEICNGDRAPVVLHCHGRKSAFSGDTNRGDRHGVCDRWTQAGILPKRMVINRIRFWDEEIELRDQERLAAAERDSAA